MFRIGLVFYSVAESGRLGYEQKKRKKYLGMTHCDMSLCNEFTATCNPAVTGRASYSSLPFSLETLLQVEAQWVGPSCLRRSLYGPVIA